MKKLLILTFLTIFGQQAMAQTLSGDYETWRNYSAGILPPVPLEAPQNWFGTDSLLVALGPLVNPGTVYKKQVFKSTDKHGGSFAALLMTRLQDTTFFGVLPAAISNARFNVDIASQTFSQTGGTPVTQRISMVNAWIKHLPLADDDSAEIDVQAILAGQGAGGTDSVIGDNTLLYGVDSNYTLVNVPIYYINSTVVPDKIIITINSSDGTDPIDSSQLWVDDVTMTTETGVIMPVFTEDAVTCYPNPTNGILYLSSTLEQPLTWEAYAANGQVIANKSFSKNATIQLGNIPAGTYFYQVTDKSTHLVQTGKFTLQP